MLEFQQQEIQELELLLEIILLLWIVMITYQKHCLKI